MWPFKILQKIKSNKKNDGDSVKEKNGDNSEKKTFYQPSNVVYSYVLVGESVWQKKRILWDCFLFQNKIKMVEEGERLLAVWLISFCETDSQFQIWNVQFVFC